MLNEFKLFAAVNESVNNNSVESYSEIEAHPFTGLDCIQAMQECSYQILAEEAAQTEFFTEVNEMLVEAAMTDAYKLDVLSESAFTNMVKGLRNLLGKLIAMVRGLIEKIKAFFAKLFGKTDQWLKIMEPKINASKATDVKYMMWDWDEGYLSTGIQGVIKALRNDWATTYGKASYTKLVEKAKAAAKSNAGKEGLEAKDIMGAEGMSDKLGNINDTMVEALKKAGLGDGTSPREVINTAITKAHGGKSEKEEIEVSGKKAGYLAFIKGAKKLADGLEKEYAQTEKELRDFKSAVDRDPNISFENESDMKKGNASAVRSALATNINYYSKYTTQYINAINQLGNINTNAIRDCVSEYMNALTRVAGGKEKKEEKK